MKYSVHVFKKGYYKHTKTIEAKSPKQAVKKILDVSGELEKYHFLVKGRRYTNKLRLIQGQPRIFKADDPYRRGIMVLINNVSEIYFFDDEEKRDKACMALESAKAVNPGEQLKSITACLEETGALPSSLMSPKTSKMSAEPVTPPGNSIPTPIEEDFIYLGAKGMGKSTWKSGSTPSPSKPKKILAVVNVRGKDTEAYPGINRYMKNINGETIKVQPVDGGLYKSETWLWRKSWLIFKEEALKAMVLPERKTGTYTNTMKGLVGTVIEVEPQGKYYMGAGFIWKKKWLKFVKEHPLQDSYAAMPLKV